MRDKLVFSSSLSPATSSLKQGVAQLQVTRVRSRKWLILRRDRSLPHFGRKAYHCLSGLFCIAVYGLFVNRTQALGILAVVGGVWITADLMRLRFPKVNNAAMKIFGNLMRREELKSVSANTYYIVGLFVVVFFFSKPVALLSTLFLAVGDPVAAVIGTLFGRHPLVGKKSLEGALANLLVTGLASALFGLFYFGLTFDHGILLGAIGGLISVIAELTPLPVNDNLSIPVISALLLSAANAVVPLF